SRFQEAINQCLSQTEPEPNCARAFIEQGGQDSQAIKDLINQACPRVPVDPTACLTDLNQDHRILDEVAVRFEAELQGVCAPVPPDNSGVGQEEPPAADDAAPGNAAQGNPSDTQEGS